MLTWPRCVDEDTGRGGSDAWGFARLPDGPDVKARLLELVTVVLSTALCLAAVEGLFAMLNARGTVPPPDPAVVPGPGTELSRFTVYHPLLGHDGKPNVRGTFGRKVVTQNSKGNRGPEVDFAKPPGVRRVVILGDSQAWGYGVHDDETIAARLADRLDRGTRGRFEVVNLGVSGYGTDQSFLKFLVQGIRYEPDFVVFVVFKNDIHENETTVAWGVEKPRFYLKEGGQLCLGNIPPPRARGWPEDAVVQAHGANGERTAFDLRRTQTYRFLAGREWRFSRPGATLASPASMADVRRYVTCVENRPGYGGEGVGEDLLVRLFEALDQLCRERKARLVALFTPKPKEVAEPSSPTYYDGIKGRFDRAGIASVDLQQLVATRSEAGELFGEGDPHLSARGSAIAAEALAEVILAEDRH